MILNPYERLDDLQYKNLKLVQDTRLFCFGTDAVLLANFATVKRGNKVLDLGCGSGIIPVLIAGKSEAEKIVGLEIQEQLFDLALRNIELNKLQDRVFIIKGDLKDYKALLHTSHFDVITCNPPYKKAGGGLTSTLDSLSIARHEIKCTLEDVISASAKLLRPAGKLNIIHRPERLSDIFFLMRNYKIEPKRLRMVHSKMGDKPSMVLVEGVRGGGSFLNIMPPLYVFDENNNYSVEINDIYSRDEE